jgi:hypothetical protein
MEIKRKNVLKISLSSLALLFSAAVLFAMYGPQSCGPNKEEEQLLKTLNALDELVEHQGVIRTVDMQREPGEGDDVYHYEAQIENLDGVPIGRLRGGRVAGFGTLKPHFKWYATPGVIEEFEPRQREENGRRHHQEE